MMTAINAAAAGKLFKRISLAAIGLTIATALAGCESSGSLLGNPSPGTPTIVPATAPPPAVPRTRVTVAPVIGAPDTVSTQLSTQLAAALGQRGVGIVSNPADRPDYTLRGYIVAARERAGTKVSYIWDVTDPTGKRLNRITGEETVASGPSKDPWGGVSAGVTQTIADKTASSVSTWLASAAGSAPGGPTAGGGVPIAGAQQPLATTAQPIVSPALGTGTVPAVANGPTTPALQPASATTGSIGASRTLTTVSGVTGAPGDGSSSLSRALQKELARNGVALANPQQAAGAYRVEGKVAVGPAASGKQPINIDWLVMDPRGQKLGTVSQKNEVPAGSLDGSWGEVADAAAAAAAQGVIKLLPQGQGQRQALN